MKQNVLRLDDYRIAPQRRSEPAVSPAPGRRSKAEACRALLDAAEALTTLMIGVGFLICTVLVLTML